MRNKKCSTCKEIKDLNAFGKDKRREDNKNPMCKICNTKASKKSRTKHPETKVAWEKANPHYNKEWFKANPGYFKDYSKARREAKTLPYYIVYCLPDFNGTDDAYVGKTNNPCYRMANHRSLGNNTKGWFILGIVATDKEALAIEATYHALGYKGATNKKIYN